MDEDEMLFRLVALFVAAISHAGSDTSQVRRHKYIIRDAERYVKWLREEN